MLDGKHADRPLACARSARRRSCGTAPRRSRAGRRIRDGSAASARLSTATSLGDRADQALAQRQLGDVDRALVEADGGEQLEHAVAQQIDRADLAGHRLGDDLDHLVELGLGAGLRGHHVVETGQDLAGGRGGGGRRHDPALPERPCGSNHGACVRQVRPGCPIGCDNGRAAAFGHRRLSSWPAADGHSRPPRARSQTSELVASVFRPARPTLADRNGLDAAVEAGDERPRPRDRGLDLREAGARRGGFRGCPRPR